jgi:hypothetical protein
MFNCHAWKLQPLTALHALLENTLREKGARGQAQLWKRGLRRVYSRPTSRSGFAPHACHLFDPSI